METDEIRPAERRSDAASPLARGPLLPESLRERLNADPEFTVQARSWSATLVFWVAEDPYTLVIDQGIVSDFSATVHKLHPRTAEFRGTAADWAALLAAVPPPFYQDFMGAIFSHGFVLAGDMEQVFSRYPAIRRVLEVMRAACNEQMIGAVRL